MFQNTPQLNPTPAADLSSDPYSALMNEAIGRTELDTSSSISAVGPLSIPKTVVTIEAGQAVSVASEDLRAVLNRPDNDEIVVSGPVVILNSAVNAIQNDDGSVTLPDCHGTVTDAEITFPGENYVIRFKGFPVKMTNARATTLDSNLLAQAA